MSRKNRPKRPAPKMRRQPEQEIPQELKELIMSGHQLFLNFEKRREEEWRDAEKKREPGGEE